MADPQEMTNEEAEVLAFIQDAWNVSHDWNVIFRRVKQKYNSSCTLSLINFCAARGYLEVIKWLRSHDLVDAFCSGDYRTCVISVLNGFYHAPQWLRNPVVPDGRPWPGGRCPWDEWTCASAAACGQLDVLQWMRNPVLPNGEPLPGGPCPWDKWACINAVENGQVEVLEYLYEAEAPYGTSDCHTIHDNCKEFLEMYGESWESRRFDVPLGWVKVAKHN